MDVVERIAGPVVIDSIGVTEAMNRVLKWLVSVLVACSKAVKGVQWRARTIADVCSIRTKANGALVVASAWITERLQAVFPFVDS